MPDNTSNKNMLIFVHGMGQDTRDSVESEIKTILSGNLEEDISKHVDIRAIAYNQVFDSWRKRAREDWTAAVNALEGRVHFSGMKDLLTGMTDIDDDHFNRTHWLDVVLYMSTLGVRVQLEVAQQLVAVLREFNNGGNLHSRRLVIMGHSLGAAVTHDTLYKLWTGGFEHDRSVNLSNLALKFHALFQVANTSRLLKTSVDPTSRETSVRPAYGGMIDRYYNVNHKYDPIALIKAFKIGDISHWLPGEDYPEDRYIDIQLKGIYDINTHSLSHYLSDPRLYCELFNEIVNYYKYSSCVQKIPNHDTGAFGDEIDEFKQTIKSVDFGHIESMKDIANAMKVLNQAQTGISASWGKLVDAIKSLTP